MPLKDWYGGVQDLTTMTFEELDALRENLIQERDEHIQYLHSVRDEMHKREAEDNIRAAAAKLPEDERNQVLQAIGVDPSSSTGTLDTK